MRIHKFTELLRTGMRYICRALGGFRARAVCRRWVMAYELEERRSCAAATGQYLLSAACCVGLALIASRKDGR